MLLNQRYKVWKKEFFQLGRLALFSILTNGFEYSFIIVDMIMLGHLGKGNLAAGAIGMLIYNIAWYFIEGFLTAQDTLVARSAVIHDLAAARYWSYVSLLTSSCLAVFFTSIFAFSPLLIPYGFYVNDHVASKAMAHALLLLPAFWLQMVYRVFQKYQQAQKIMFPSLVCSLIGVVANILGNYLFMFAFGIGFWGCGIATSLSRFLMLALLYRVQDELKEMRVELRYNPDAAPLATGVDHNRTWNAVDNRILGTDQLDSAPLSESELGDATGDVNDEEGIQLTSTRHSSNSSNSTGASLEGLRTVRKKQKKSKSRSFGDYNQLADEDDVDVTSPDADDDDNRRRNDEEEVQQQSLLRPASEVDGHKNKLYANIWKFCMIGLPGALMLSIDCWSYELCALIAAQLGTISLDCYVILVLTINLFYLVFPFSISVAATVRIGKLLEQNRHAAALVVSRLCLVLGFLLMLVSATGVYFLMDYVGFIFTADQDIVLRMRGWTTLYAVLFQVLYGMQGCLLGPLRCTTQQWEILGFGFVSMWPVGLGLGYYLAFETYPKMGLEGLWLGLMVGMGMQCCGLLFLYSTVDWEKEAKRLAIRHGRAVRLNSGGLASPTPVAAGTTDAQTLSLIHPHEVGAPAIGSRAIGGFPTSFVDNDEELDEFEIVELGRDPNAEDQDSDDEEGGGSRKYDRGQHMERDVEMTRLDERDR